MTEIDELIQFGNENDRLDFKLIQYKKEMYVDLLKDIMAMANSHTKDDRYIIIGLKPKSAVDRGLVGIKDIITDSASYQQLVHNNIEPELSIEYFDYKFSEFDLAIFKISRCDSPPYLMKKDYCKLSKGDGYVRKASRNEKLTRNDYDIYYQNKCDEKYFNEDVTFSFITENEKNEITLVSCNRNELPSEIARKRIENILIIKKAKAERFKDNSIVNMFDLQANYIQNLHGSSSYENRDIPTLERNLNSVEETYSHNDNYYLFEKNSNKCNIKITINGNKYIKNAIIVVTIPKIKGLIVSDKVYTDPGSSINNVNYPNVNNSTNSIIIKNYIGDIPHLLVKDAFKIPIRILASDKIQEKTLLLKIELFGENIKTSISREIIVPLSIKLN